MLGSTGRFIVLNSSYGGKGGYSTGTLTLTQKTTIYIYVGGSGNSVTSASNSIYPGGFNGGGYRYNYKGGGGATDIRIGSASLYARVIVAGGGGSDGSSGYSGGYAGGVSGARGNFGCGSYGYGGSQTASYSSLSAINSQGTTNSSSNCAAGFGFGGFGCYYASGYGGAGGGGWYGGQGTYPDGSGDDDGGGGGGSGYVYTSSSASNYPQGCLLNSSYYLSDASNLSGNESFKSPSGSTETGHSDNGYCRITCYIKKKTLHCKMNNEIKKAAPVFVRMNNKIYDAGANAVMDFAYTGTAQAISLPRGQYIIECWGAQGGYRSSSDYGGKGGYSVGTLTLTQSTDLYIYVGGAGNSSTTRLSNNSSIYEGGFNGGGHRYDYKGGGGATDVRIGKDSLYARIIVAGGGGSDGATNKKGMYGGGLEGGSTTESCGSGGYGGTQTGNTWLTTTRSTNASYDTASCYAGFGFGGNGNYASSGYGGAGGGGWYGGSGSYPDGSGDDDRGGGGGSGYVYTAETAVNYPDGNYVNSSYYLTNAQTIAGNQSFKSPDGTNETGHTGNGFCRITRKSGKIFVIGHKNPDTDSICSAIAYADIKNRTSQKVKYIPKRAGQINEETEYVLNRFGMQPPGYLSNIGTQIKDMDIRMSPEADKSMSLKNAWDLMMEKSIVSLPIRDREGQLEGLITIGDIAKTYMDTTDSYLLSRAKTQYRRIAETNCRYRSRGK